MTSERIDEFAIDDPVESLRADIEALRTSSLPAGMSVTGYLYDVETGELRTEIATGPLRTPATPS